MSISQRLYIRWLPDEASEPTSTLVLTAPNRQFVDLRLVKPAINYPSSPFTVLDWAIGGQAIGSSNHGVWVHQISSRTEHPEDEKDEGEMFPHLSLPDVTLERGKMVHPESGEMREYEEAWKDIEVLPVPHPDTKRVSVVLELDTPRKRGMVCRVGQFIQGIVRDRAGVTVERWAWSRGEGAGWTRVAKLGEATMVCEATWKENLEEGQFISDNGSDWIVKAVRVW